MKSGGFKSRGGGLKRRAPSAAPEGVSRTRLGELRVRDPDYMAALHARRAPVLDIAPHIQPAGVMDLHHGPSPVPYSQRRNFDSGVVPLDHNVHMALEAGEIEERVFARTFAVWSTFSYWCYRHGRTGTEEDALAFQLWTLERLEEPHA